MTVYRSVCAFFFWLKALLAIIVVLSLLTTYSWLIYKIRIYSLTVVPPSQPAVFVFRDDGQTTSTCAHEEGFARLEPADGDFIWGFDIQWDRDLPTEVVSRLGKRPAYFNSFINMNATDFEKNIILWNAQQCAKVGAMLEITVIPKILIETIPDVLYKEFALTMRYINFQYGVPVFLRFGHEMNGNWFPEYGMRPIEYKQAFQKITNYVRAVTNMTAMVWAPNVGNGYPFRSSGYDGYIPTANDPDPQRAANFLELNTNNIGASADILDNLDDPYTPYYPGDGYVDWVGLSVYNYLHSSTTHQTTPVDLNALTTGVTSVIGNAPHNNFYQNFVVARNKPFMLVETGAAYISNGPTTPPGYVAAEENPTQTELAIKQSWWQAINDASASPALSLKFKASTWFEEIKLEQSYDDANVQVLKDYHITFKDFLKNAFLTDTSGSRFKWAPNFKFDCSGKHLMFQDHVLDYEEPSPVEVKSVANETPLVEETIKDHTSELIALYVSAIDWYTTDQDLESLVANAGQSDKFLPLELSFKEDKANGKSKCEAFLKFSCHDAAAAVKSFIESSTSYKVTFANLATKPNPFRETPMDSRHSERDSQPRSRLGYDQQYYDQAYMARYYQGSVRGGTRMGRHGGQSYHSAPYPDRDTRRYRDGNSRDRDRRGAHRYSDDHRHSQERDSRDYRK